MTPDELGLPSKFKSFRPGQEQTIIDLVSSEKRATLMSAPTGSGKSVNVVSTALCNGYRTMIVTHSRNLQDQYMADFASIGMVDIRGQSNYPCLAVQPGGELEGYAPPSSSCAEGPCHHDTQCTLKNRGCLYYDQVRKASKAKLVVTNYSYWIHFNKHSNKTLLGEFEMLVLDEAHNAPDILADICSVSLSHETVRELLDLSLPEVRDGDRESWMEWAYEAFKVCESRYGECKDSLTHSVATQRGRVSSLLRRYSNLSGQLRDLAAAHKWRNSDPSSPGVFIPGVSTDWVAERTIDGIRFAPVWAHAYAESLLFTAIPRIILTSATLQQAVGKYLGINKSDSEYMEVASTFHPERRPFIYIPTTRVDRHMSVGQERVWANKIDSIIEARHDRKGILHTQSYDRAEIFASFSRHRDSGRLILHDRRSTRAAIEKFRSAGPGVVLVSPAVREGYDFSAEQCRYQIIGKVPFADTRSLIVQARNKSDKLYLDYQTALALIQMYGRGMRSEDDWAETFIVDDHAAWFLKKCFNMRLIPQWVRSAYEISNVIPPPLSAKAKSSDWRSSVGDRPGKIRIRSRS